MNTNYVNIGYDIRQIPKNGILMSADINIWEQDDVLYTEAKLINGIEENCFQLLSPLNKSAFNDLCFLVKNSKNKSVLIFLSIESNVYREITGKSYTEFTADNISISPIGFDICDIDGFFSIFDMRKDCFYRDKLLDENEIEDAKNIITLANYLIPTHAPFYFVKIYNVNL